MPKSAKNGCFSGTPRNPFFRWGKPKMSKFVAFLKIGKNRDFLIFSLPYIFFRSKIPFFSQFRLPPPNPGALGAQIGVKKGSFLAHF